jgi:asparagine synthase (glutamine-hydrolysing)
MCGICGVVGSPEHVDPDVLFAMTQTLSHRGPDDDGFLVNLGEGMGPAVGLGFRRLSIIDLATGHQPITNESGTLHVICNGEIYNFRTLRAELERAGHRFATNSDVEVIVHLYEEEGPDLVERLNGMFAFALWDTRRKRLLLARDRLGKKPLYYADVSGTLLFGSELKALLQHPACPRSIDPEALSCYLAFEYVPSPLAIFSGVRKLPPGHVLEWGAGRGEIRPYWEPRILAERPARSPDAWAGDLRGHLVDAVRLRLVSDVPIGVFLSGGVDSSAIVATMAQLVDPAEIKTFSIAFEERSFDESEFSRLVAARFGTEHHEELFTPSAMVDALTPVSQMLDEPFADPSVLPTYLLSRFAQRSVKVALGGDGADELFAGYPTFAAHRLADLYRLPSWLHRRVMQLAGLLPVSTDNLSPEFKLKRFLRGALERPELRDQLWLGALSHAELRQLLVAPPLIDPLARLVSGSGATPAAAADRLTLQYLRYYLEGDILPKVDRASMATSLEVRAPFLDFRLVEFALSIPRELNLRGLDGKRVLKRALQGTLPQSILRRPKKGFGIPISLWLKREFRWLLDELLEPGRLRAQGIFEPAVVASLIADHLAGRSDNRKPLWTLLMFQLWYENYGRAPVRVASPAGGYGEKLLKGAAI